MIKKDLLSFAEDKWQQHYKSVTELSKNESGKSLVTDNRCLICFDDVTVALFSKDIPSSADCLAFLKDGTGVVLIEFKTGFRRKINKQNFKPDMMVCNRPENGFCSQYAKLFFEKQYAELNELRSSIRNKAIESFVTLEKRIFPLCGEGKECSLYFWAIIDADSMDVMQDVLYDLSQERGKTSETIVKHSQSDSTLQTLKIPDNQNQIISLKKSLHRLSTYKDNNGCRYYYDDIDVLTPHEFKKKLDRLI